LQYVAYQENIDMDENAAGILARLADGGMRDGLSLLDQVASATTGMLTAEKVYNCLGIAGTRRCGELMGCIADHNTRKALELFNQLYAEGKDLSAMLDELACMTRDLMIMKTAPGTGVTMLSGVATDEEVSALTERFSNGELVRMMTLLQQTIAGFARSGSRRMDAELCIMNLCQPELSLDAESLNARLTRLEEQIKSGSITIKSVSHTAPAAEEEDERPPMPDDADAPPVDGEPQPVKEPKKQESAAPAGFWTDLMAASRKELKPPVQGFFVAAQNSPLRGALKGDTLELRCAGAFVADSINKPVVLEVVARKASALLGRPVRVTVVDITAKPAANPRMQQLVNFGKAHSDVVRIKE
jgi:DNA polymerase-3 subunit gamma/tau